MPGVFLLLKLRILSVNRVCELTDQNGLVQAVAIYRRLYLDCDT